VADEHTDLSIERRGDDRGRRPGEITEMVSTVTP